MPRFNKSAAFDRISDILFPAGDAAHEWDHDTLENVASIVREHTDSLHTVTLEVTDLWREGSSWTGNYCWKREYTASAPTRKGAIRKVLAMTGYKGWRLNYWANSRESWKVDGACVGAYIVERT